jgi:hypothetical protein
VITPHAPSEQKATPDQNRQEGRVAASGNKKAPKKSGPFFNVIGGWAYRAGFPTSAKTCFAFATF